MPTLLRTRYKIRGLQVVGHELAPSEISIDGASSDEEALQHMIEMHRAAKGKSKELSDAARDADTPLNTSNLNRITQ